jgi:uncharacterized surface protein with fasciclin (FAS1) repeats
MKYSIKNIKQKLVVIFCVLTITSCNKSLERFGEPLSFPQNAGTQTIADFLNTDPNYTFLLAALKKAAPAGGTAGALLTSLGDKNNLYTLFAPDNNAFIASGIPSTAAINSAAFRAGQLDSLLRYHIIPGEQYLSTGIPTNFPNLQLPSALSVGILTGTVPFNLSIYPSRRSNGFWVNNIPVKTADQVFINGILHTTATLVAPPGVLTANIIINDPAGRFTLFAALIARADQGQTDPTKTFNYALNIPFASLTIFAPTNTAMKAFINAASGGLVPLAAPDAVFIGFINNNLPIQSAAGIVAYHFLPTKDFSVNFPTTAAFFPTFLNSAVPSHPGVKVQSVLNAALFGIQLQVTGIGNGGVAAVSNAPADIDRNAINGVVHIIDKVLLPQ